MGGSAYTFCGGRGQGMFRPSVARRMMAFLRRVEGVRILCNLGLTRPIVNSSCGSESRPRTLRVPRYSLMVEFFRGFEARWSVATSRHAGTARLLPNRATLGKTAMVVEFRFNV
jgi:hypothetical protein